MMSGVAQDTRGCHWLTCSVYWCQSVVVVFVDNGIVVVHSSRDEQCVNVLQER